VQWCSISSLPAKAMVAGRTSNIASQNLILDGSFDGSGLNVAQVKSELHGSTSISYMIRHQRSALQGA
jgi:hypothetical protein